MDDGYLRYYFKNSRKKQQIKPLPTVHDMEKFFESLSSDSSDEEVFVGNKTTTREIRKRVLLGRRTISTVTFSDASSEDSSVELIELQSEPEFLQESPSPEKPCPEKPCPEKPCRRSISQPDLRESLAPPAWQTDVTDESFVAMEAQLKAVADASCSSDELDSTFDRIEKILKVGSQKDDTNVTLRRHDVNIISPQSERNVKQSASTLKKPFPGGIKTTPTFKTPAKPIKVQKGVRSTPKITQCRSPLRDPAMFQNLVSPVGFYIKNSPRAPLIQTVRPRRPLPGLSAIPKRVDTPVRCNKENVSCNLLPSKAYVGAKQTKVIVTPDATHLPKNNQVKKMASALPHPTVMRHEKRTKTTPKPLSKAKRDDSFAKLSLSQADISVCVVKSAALTESLKRH